MIELLKSISLIFMLMTSTLTGSSNVENISYIDKFDNSNLTVYQEFKYDINKDDIEDNIVIYTSAGKDENGDFMWDDGQYWHCIVNIDGVDYDLYSAYLHGDMDFQVLELYKGEDVVPCIKLSVNEWAGINIYHYTFDKENNNFVKELAYSTNDYSDNGINVMNQR